MIDKSEKTRLKYKNLFIMNESYQVINITELHTFIKPLILVETKNGTTDTSDSEYHEIGYKPCHQDFYEDVESN